jgi:putative transposase
VTVYRMISAEKARTPVSVACELLGVSRSGYCAWASRAPSDRALSDARLLEKIREIWQANWHVYGARACMPSCGWATASVSGASAWSG